VPENIALYIYIYISQSTTQLTRGQKEREEAMPRRRSNQLLISSSFGLYRIQTGPCTEYAGFTWGQGSEEGGQSKDSRAQDLWAPKFNS
jgi:hypothetical protein